jgi:hypothetical protein
VTPLAQPAPRHPDAHARAGARKIARKCYSKRCHGTSNSVSPDLSALQVLQLNAMSSACDIDVMRADTSSHLIFTAQDTRENLPFHVAKLPGRGHALVATRDIGAGQAVFREQPYVSVQGRAFLELPLREQPCSHCGICADSAYVCSGGCHVRFCSAACEELEGRVGHQFLCGAHAAGGVIDTLMREPPRTQSEGVTAHSVVLVLQVFARIAKLMEAGASCADSQIKIMQGFHLVDYVRCIHAIVRLPCSL